MFSELDQDVYWKGTKIRCLSDVYKKSSFIGRGKLTSNNMFWVNIPKNASNSVNRAISGRDFNWLDGVFVNPIVKENKALVILRDPVERWYKCFLESWNIAHEMSGYRYLDEPELFWENWEVHKNKWTRFEYTNQYFDLHLIRQRDHLIGLDIDNAIFVYMDESFADNMKYVLGKPLPHINSTETNEFKQEVIRRMDGIVFNNEEVRERVQKAYEPDYAMINWLKSMQKIMDKDTFVP